MPLMERRTIVKISQLSRGWLFILYKKDYTNNVFDEDIRQIYDNWILKIKSI